MMLFTNFMFFSSVNNVLKVDGVPNASTFSSARIMCKNYLGSLLFKIKIGHGV